MMKSYIAVALFLVILAASKVLSYSHTIDCYQTYGAPITTCPIPGVPENTPGVAFLQEDYSNGLCSSCGRFIRQPYFPCYRFYSHYVWVAFGCSGRFRACTCDPSHTLRVVHCESHDYGYTECSVPDATRVSSVTVGEQESRDGCILNHSYGALTNVIWTNYGCKGYFCVCYE